MSLYALNRDGQRFERLTGPDGLLAAKAPDDSVWRFNPDTFDALYELGPDEVELFAREELVA